MTETVFIEAFGHLSLSQGQVALIAKRKTFTACSVRGLNSWAGTLLL